MDSEISINELKNKISEDLKLLNHSYVIIVDDIDRKTPKEILPIIQLVKQMADFPNIIFILSMDYDRVSKMLVNEYREPYIDYLKKIVNQRILLNTMNYDELKAIFTAGMQEITSEHYPIKHWGGIFEYYCLKIFQKEMRLLKQNYNSDVDDLIIFNTLFNRIQPIFYKLFPFIDIVREYSTIRIICIEFMNTAARNEINTITEIKDNFINKIITAIENNGISKVRESVKLVFDEKSKHHAQFAPISNYLTEFADKLDIKIIKNELKTNTIHPVQSGLKQLFVSHGVTANDLINDQLINETRAQILNYKPYFYDIDGSLKNNLLKIIQNWIIYDQIQPRDVKQLIISYKSKLNGKLPETLFDHGEVWKPIIDKSISTIS